MLWFQRRPILGEGEGEGTLLNFPFRSEKCTLGRFQARHLQACVTPHQQGQPTNKSQELGCFGGVYFYMQVAGWVVMFLRCGCARAGSRLSARSGFCTQTYASQAPPFAC